MRTNLKASKRGVCLSTSRNKFWLGMTISVSTVLWRNLIPSCASLIR